MTSSEHNVTPCCPDCGLVSTVFPAGRPEIWECKHCETCFIDPHARSAAKAEERLKEIRKGSQ